MGVSLASSRSGGGLPQCLMSLGKGAAIFSQDDPADHWFEVVSGVVRTCRLHAEGRRQLTGFFFPGDVFGVELGEHRTTAEAVTPVVVRRHVRPVLAGLDVRSVIASEATEMLGRALESAEDRILLLGLRTAAERLAGFLLAMAERSPTAGLIELPMSRCDIADYLGLTSETVSRTFTDFLRKGVIAFEGPQRVRIRAPGRLRRLSGEDEEDAWIVRSAARRARERSTGWDAAPAAS